MKKQKQKAKKSLTSVPQSSSNGGSEGNDLLGLQIKVTLLCGWMHAKCILFLNDRPNRGL